MWKFFFPLLLFPLFLLGTPYESGLSPWGADAELAYVPHPPLHSQKSPLGKKACISMIRFFQVYISPIDGPRSSYFPTSSQYALEAINKYGPLMGIALGCDRLLRENGERWIYPTKTLSHTTRKWDPVR